MKKRNNKKGFTIVELVIVIAVIAILAAVLIPTFAGVIEKAQKNANLQQARNFYTLVEANTVAGADYKKDSSSKTYTLTMGREGLEVAKSGAGSNVDAETILWNVLGKDAKTYSGATVGIETDKPITGNNTSPWIIKAFYFQAKGNSYWTKINLEDGSIADCEAPTAGDKYVSCVFDGKAD